jgi:N-acetylmuramoyl-L-alanine amidase
MRRNAVMRRIELVVNRLLVLTLLGSALLWLFSCASDLPPVPSGPATPPPLLEPTRPPPAPAATVAATGTPAPPAAAETPPFARGRTFTPPPRAAFTALPLVEKLPGGEIAGTGRLQYADRGTMRPTAIVLHITSGRTLAQTIAALEARNAAVHFIVDETGRAYQAMDSLEHPGRAARGLDDVALHVDVAGKGDRDLLDNKAQLRKVVDLLRALVFRYDIPVHNYDVIGRQGIFSHAQAIKRYGGMIPNDPLHPGEEYMKAVLTALGGTFFDEKDWKDRYEPGWVFVLEGSGSSGAHAGAAPLPRKGRGLTPTPRAVFPEVEQNPDGTLLEAKRLRYSDRGKIAPTGVVLHFTATEDFDVTQRVLEDRNLCSTFIVDTDGKIYQTLDAVEDRPAAAADTNEFAVQIEIVGRNETVLLGNEAQKKKVVALMTRLCEKYSIPKTNEDIDSRKGVFSHGQQKKRWGHSAHMHPGLDFDPGETYMKEVLEGIGGTYVPEAKWKDRQDDRWAILYDDWNP